jgi:hypothetical protein
MPAVATVRYDIPTFFMNATLWIAVGAFTIPAVVSLLANLIVWRKDLSGTAQRARTVDEATKAITFWEQWLKLKLALDPNDESAKRRYQKHIDAVALMLEVEAAWEGYKPWEEYSKIRRVWLLVRNVSITFLIYRFYHYAFLLGSFSLPVIEAAFAIKIFNKHTWLEFTHSPDLVRVATTLSIMCIVVSPFSYLLSWVTHVRGQKEYDRVQKFKMQEQGRG